MDYQEFSERVYVQWEGKMTNEPFLTSLVNGELSQFITTLKGEQQADAELARCYIVGWNKYLVMTNELNSTVKETVDVRKKTIAVFDGYLPKVKQVRADGDIVKAQAMIRKVADYCKGNPSTFTHDLMNKYQTELNSCREILAFQQQAHEELDALRRSFAKPPRTPTEVSVYLMLWPSLLQAGEATKTTLDNHIETIQRMSPKLDQFRLECQAFLNVLE